MLPVMLSIVMNYSRVHLRVPLSRTPYFFCLSKDHIQTNLNESHQRVKCSRVRFNHTKQDGVNAHPEVDHSNYFYFKMKQLSHVKRTRGRIVQKKEKLSFELCDKRRGSGLENGCINTLEGRDKVKVDESLS